ncbi:SEC-C domain-containing protein, partial [Candidatus Peregrinibacteria bacterium]|nr:SEC-C domain-containing protein [Candidatus Peregrinibacteria bacterium]MBI3816350.1 SEC-C domain-containing protein [Candidatus Peregrinibacteria bacterium]
MQTADACLRGKVGRNEPCPCGSRKKYKKCCLPRDEEKEREELRTQEFQRWGGQYQEEGEDACGCPTCGAVHHDHDSDGEENDEDREEYARSDDDPLPPVLDVLARYLGKR